VYHLHNEHNKPRLIGWLAPSLGTGHLAHWLSGSSPSSATSSPASSRATSRVGNSRPRSGRSCRSSPSASRSTRPRSGRCCSSRRVSTR
jgi:hypothetical protein